MSDDICRPILTNNDLLIYAHSRISWPEPVEPLAERCAPQKLGLDFQNIRDYRPTIIEDETTRPKVLVVHDLDGNYRDDR